MPPLPPQTVPVFPPDGEGAGAIGRRGPALGEPLSVFCHLDR